ncbi:RICIN domain-containing protein [Streptomyces sp. NPDC055287]
MGSSGRLDPGRAEDAVAFVAMMQELKTSAGLTYRQLEQRASDDGAVLARSTLADTLAGRKLPSPELLTAFVRACGAENEVTKWLSARNQIEEAAQSALRDVPISKPVASRRARIVVMGATVVVLVTVTSIGLWLVNAGDDRPTPREPQGSGVSAAPRGRPAAQLGGWVEIRPARTPHLCLTEGRDRTGSYVHAVAAQRPCGEARPPHTYLKQVTGAETAYSIQWHHPQHGLGCLTVRRSGPAKGLLEPWTDCSESRDFQRFRFERVGDPAKGRYRLRPGHSAQCIGIRDDDAEAGAEAVEEPCTGRSDQEFVIESAA